MKTWFKHQPVENLEEWLKIATKDLCQQAKTRITTEIETHFTEAIEEHLRNGKPEDGSKKLALQELGDPKAALRRFRTKHLTEKEEAKLNAIYQTARKRPSLGVVIAVLSLALVMMGALHRADIHSTALAAVMFITCIFTPSVSYIVARRMPAKSSVPWLVFIMQILQSFLIPVFFLVAWWPGEHFYVVPELRWLFRYPLIVGSVLISLNILYWLRIWQKIRRDNTNWNIANSGSDPTSAT